MGWQRRRERKRREGKKEEGGEGNIFREEESKEKTVRGKEKKSVNLLSCKQLLLTVEHNSTSGTVLKSVNTIIMLNSNNTF